MFVEQSRAKNMREVILQMLWCIQGQPESDVNLSHLTWREGCSLEGRSRQKEARNNPQTLIIDHGFLHRQP